MTEDRIKRKNIIKKIFSEEIRNLIIKKIKASLIIDLILMLTSLLASRFICEKCGITSTNRNFFSICFLFKYWVQKINPYHLQEITFNINIINNRSNWITSLNTSFNKLFGLFISFIFNNKSISFIRFIYRCNQWCSQEFVSHGSFLS